MFRGRYDHTIDGKGRLSIPAKFREWLAANGENQLIVTNFIVDGMRCLDVYPMDEWIKFEEEVRKRPKFDSRMVLFQNYYLGGACECALDTHGRILIPPVLRKYADLKRDVALVSALEKFRIWDQSQIWNKVHGAAENKLMQDPDFLSDIGF